MNKVNKSQVIVLTILALLLVMTPFLPSSLRPTYLYLMFNILIIALGVEAGLLSTFVEPLEDKKHHVSVIQKHAYVSDIQKHSHVSVIQKHAMLEQEEKETCFVSKEQNETKNPKVVEKYACEKNISFVDVSNVEKVKNCPSRPSLFYIEDGEDDLEVKCEEVEVEDEIGGVSGQELFAKAEAFIGNFYKQLKMQREEYSCA